jgi:hypothetical protein
MPATIAEILTPKEAARRIFNTDTPSEQQVSNVIALMKSGAIARTAPDQWTTTVPAVADYLTRVESARLDPRDRPTRGHATTSIDSAGTSVSQFYRGLIKDYFLAVLLKRQLHSRSQTFQRVVVASQAVVLLLGLLIIALAAAQVLKKPWVSPEQKIVEAWLSNKFQEVTLRNVSPHTSEPNAVIAKYTYRDGGRIIESKMKFTLSGGQVLSVDSSE